MTGTDTKKIAAAAGIVAFTLLAFGSLLTGARVLAALIRGIEGLVAFGAVGWCAAKWLETRGGFAQPAPPQPEEPKGAHLDETV